MKLTKDDKTKRILVAGGVLVLVCMVCLFVSIRAVDKYRKKVAEATVLEQRLDDLKQDIKRQEIKTKELEAMRYDLSLEKGQISEDYATIKEKYVAQAKASNTAQLISFLSIASAADTKYKGSKNQRLLVEVMLMQLCSIEDNTSQKKKP